MKHTPTASVVPITSHIFHGSKNVHFQGLGQIVRGGESSHLASGLLIESHPTVLFTAQQEAPAVVLAGASGWAVNN